MRTPAVRDVTDRAGRGVRRLAARLLLTAPLAVLAACLGAWCGSAFNPDRALAAEFVRGWRQGEALERHRVLATRCTAAKDAVTAEVVAGGLTLPEAARRFGEAGERADGGPAGCRCRRAVADQEASLNVLSWVASRVDDYPDGAKAFARLLAEYRERFGEPPPASLQTWRKALERGRAQPAATPEV